MLVKKTSPITGQEVSMEIPNVTQEQINRWQSGEGFIQDIMPNLSANEREFIMTGLTGEEYDNLTRPTEE